MFRLLTVTSGAFIALLGAILIGCAAGESPQGAYNPPPVVANDAPGQKPQSDVVGVYVGTTRADCAVSLPSRCNAVQNVTITLLENENSTIGGYYKCSYGNMDCFHLNETGKVVDASLNGSRISMRVMMRDGTSCMFTGLRKSGDVQGGYSCYTGGSLFERGSWRAKQQY